MNRKTNSIKNLHWIMKKVWQVDKKYLFWLTLVIVISGFLPVVTTLISQNIINKIQFKMTWDDIFPYILGYVLTNLFSVLFLYCNNYYRTKFNLHFSLRINEKILKKASKLSLACFENSETYDKISMAQSQGNGKILIYLDNCSDVLTKGIGMCSFLVILFSFQPLIIAIILIVPIIKFIVSTKFNTLTFNVAKERMNDLRKSNYIKYLLTYGDFYKEIKIYNLSEFFSELFKKYLNRFNKQDISIEKKRTIALSIISILETVIDGMIFSYVVYKGISGQIFLGNIMTYMKAITQIEQQMTGMLELISIINKDSLFIDQVKEYFMLPEIYERTGKIIDCVRNIKVEGLSYKYKNSEKYVLKNINININESDTIAIVGQNGSGKTTLIKILMGFYLDYEGEIYINDINLKELNLQNYREKIATLFQDFIKYEATFRENLAYGNLSILHDDEKIRKIYEKFGLSQLINSSNKNLDCQIGYWFDNGKQISLGQWQKVALSRAFAKEADLIFLDEPNSALDPISESCISNLYSKLFEKKIAVVVAHKFNHFCQNMNRIVVLQEGRIVEEGTHEELMKKEGIYKKMYNIQIGNRD